MAVNLPVQNFFSRMIQPIPWTRPSDWPVITDAPNEVQFLFSDVDDAACTIRTQFTRTSGSQNIVIDWGDGTTSTVTTTAQTNTTKTYTPGTGTPCSRGYTTFVIRVYFTGVGVSTLNVCRIIPVAVATNTGNIQTQCPVLEMYYGDGTQTTSMTYYYSGSNGLGNYNYLEYAKLPSTVTFTDMTGTFQDCSNLYVVVMPASASSLTGFSNIFSGCFLLQSASVPSNATAISNISAAFQNCFNITSISLPSSLNSCTTFLNTFNNCYALKNLTIPSVNSCITFQNAFLNCYALEWVKFTSLPTFATATTVNFSSAFGSCFNLQNVYFPASCSPNARYTFNSVFSSSIKLNSIVFPIDFSAISMNNSFSGCTNLKSAVFQSSMPFCIDMGFMFSQCTSLTDVALPSSVSSSGVTFNGTFSACRSLEIITIDSSYQFTNLSGTFSNCFSLKTLNWNPGIQNSVTTLSSCFNSCYLLTSITLPTSMNACTFLTSTFGNCFNLTSVNFPASMNAVTDMNNAFSSCTNLISVTLPTSMSSCTVFTSIFNGCRKIETILMPATVSSATTTLQAAFQNCYSLKSITFPTTQMSSLTTIQTMFSGCANLTTITNFDKVGSLTATPLVNASTNNLARLISISFSCPLSILSINGTGSTQRSDVQSVRLLNTSAGQWTGVSPQINVSNTNMSTANLVQLFNDMAAQGTVTAKTINITSAVGAAGLTAADRLIITSRGWTITG
jgi:hypothetical protein